MKITDAEGKMAERGEKLRAERNTLIDKAEAKARAAVDEAAGAGSYDTLVGLAKKAFEKPGETLSEGNVAAYVVDKYNGYNARGTLFVRIERNGIPLYVGEYGKAGEKGLEPCSAMLDAKYGRLSVREAVALSFDSDAAKKSQTLITEIESPAVIEAAGDAARAMLNPKNDGRDEIVRIAKSKEFGCDVCRITVGRGDGNPYSVLAELLPEAYSDSPYDNDRDPEPVRTDAVGLRRLGGLDDIPESAAKPSFGWKETIEAVVGGRGAPDIGERMERAERGHASSALKYGIIAASASNAESDSKLVEAIGSMAALAEASPNERFCANVGNSIISVSERDGRGFYVEIFSRDGYTSSGAWADSPKEIPEALGKIKEKAEAEREVEEMRDEQGLESDSGKDETDDDDPSE